MVGGKREILLIIFSLVIIVLILYFGKCSCGMKEGYINSAGLTTPNFHFLEGARESPVIGDKKFYSYGNKEKNIHQCLSKCDNLKDPDECRNECLYPKECLNKCGKIEGDIARKTCVDSCSSFIFTPDPIHDFLSYDERICQKSCLKYKNGKYIEGAPSSEDNYKYCMNHCGKL